MRRAFKSLGLEHGRAKREPMYPHNAGYMEGYFLGKKETSMKFLFSTIETELPMPREIL